MGKTGKISQVIVATHDGSRRWAWRNGYGQAGELDLVEAGCIEEVRQLLQTGSHALLVLYLDLPGGNALELVRQGRARKMPVLTFGTGAREARVALQNGAHGYLDVGDSAEETTGALSAVLQNTIYVSKRWEQSVLHGLHRPSQKGKKRMAVESFSPTEHSIWELLAAGKKTVEIAKNRGVSVKTIESHLHRMQVKLECPGLPELRKQAVLWSTTET